jgi:hypothetical protein
MKETAKCPSCNGDRVVRGRYSHINKSVNQQQLPPRFRPDGIKKFTALDPSIRLDGGEYAFSACLDCGCFWSRLNAEKLKKTVRKYIKEEAS